MPWPLSTETNCFRLAFPRHPRCVAKNAFSVPGSAYGFFIPYYDTQLYGQIIFQLAIIPSLHIWGVLFLAFFCFPDYCYDLKTKCIYTAFAVSSYAFRFMSLIGTDDKQLSRIFEGLFSGTITGLWSFAVYYMYMSKDKVSKQAAGEWNGGGYRLGKMQHALALGEKSTQWHEQSTDFLPTHNHHCSRTRPRRRRRPSPLSFRRTTTKRSSSTSSLPSTYSRSFTTC